MPRTTKADYRRHYNDYQGTPEQIKKRSQRNKARRKMIAAGKAKKGDGKDVHHKNPIRSGGGNSTKNLAVVSRAKNRGHGSSPGKKK